MGYATTSNRIGSYEPNENALQEPCIRRALYFPQRNNVYESFTAICFGMERNNRISIFTYIRLQKTVISSPSYIFTWRLSPSGRFSIYERSFPSQLQFLKNSASYVSIFTSIKADYILSSHYKLDNFIFIIKATAKDELKCDFVCCSIFEKDDQRNYETNQRSRTLLRKERIHIPSGTSNILFNKLFPQ